MLSLFSTVFPISRINRLSLLSSGAQPGVLECSGFARTGVQVRDLQFCFCNHPQDGAASPPRALVPWFRIDLAESGFREKLERAGLYATMEFSCVRRFFRESS
jgi:hypothetical protein